MSPMRCDNCGHDRDAGRYCPNCGQSDRNFRRALPALVGEVLRETFELDSRAARSLITLLTRPGRLSLEFSRNRRADYVSPIRLYLFASLVFFFALSLTTDVATEVPQPERVEPEDATAAETDIAALASLLAEPRRQRMQEILQRSETSVARLATVQLARDVAADPPGPVGRYMVGYVIDALYDPVATIDDMLEQLPVAMFFMLPVYAALLALFYAGRRRFYVEHLVFALHVHTVTYIVFTVILLLPGNAAGGVMASAGSAVGNGLLALLVGYQYLALRNCYGGGYLSTAARFLGLFAAYALLLLPVVLSAVLLALTLG